MQQALARTFRDDTLQVGYRIAGADEYVDAAGSPVELPAEGDRRVATAIEREGVPLAVIVHDRALLEQPGLVESATAAARLALDNERLQAELRTQLDALRRSRARLVQTSDAERRRLERNLHDGAQQRLLGVGLALQLLRNRVGAGEAAHLLAEAELELQHALDELRELARGLHPAILADQGLASAARTLAGRAPIPVTVTERGERLPAAVETAGYFVVAEALANVAKYAQAERAWVTIERQNGSARIEIVDDGVGGADSEGGSGLRGLADRVEALDGRLRVWTPRGGGTRVRAEMPCG
jgi:signal transduction histidine kinase